MLGDSAETLKQSTEALNMIIPQFIIGPALMFIGWTIWRAGRNETWKKRIERMFLDANDDLFASDAPYSGHVKWMRYVAFPAGLAIIVPTAIAIDIILGMVASGIFWWMSRQKAAHDKYVRGDKKKKAG